MSTRLALHREYSPEGETIYNRNTRLYTPLELSIEARKGNVVSFNTETGVLKYLLPSQLTVAQDRILEMYRKAPGVYDKKHCLSLDEFERVHGIVHIRNEGRRPSHFRTYIPCLE